MTAVLVTIGVLAALAIGGVALALHWSNTPHGRLKPIFAFAFRLARLFGSEAAEGVLPAARMTSPEATERIRRDFLKQGRPLAKVRPLAGTVDRRELAGPGGPLPVTVYRPVTPAPVPLLVYFHGGGFVVGSPEYTEVVTRGLSRETPAVVVSVDYRMAPEHPFPAAVEDAVFAVGWCHEHAEELGARPGPVAVAGDSAGGNLAAVVSQRDVRDGRHQIGLQALIYPCTDVSRTDRPSQRAFERGYGLSMRDVTECFAAYAPGVDRADPDLSPLKAPSLEGLPRAYVVTAGFDVLRDEGDAYADALAKAGVTVRHEREPTMPHGYVTMTRICVEAERTISQIAAELRGLGETPERASGS